MPVEDIIWLDDFINGGTKFEQAIHILRRTHFPFFYDPHPWVAGESQYYYVVDCMDFKCETKTFGILSSQNGGEHIYYWGVY